MSNKVPFISGSVHGLRLKRRLAVEGLYESMDESCELVLGVRAFLPHRHFNPGNFHNPTPAKVYDVIGTQLKYRTSHLIVVGEVLDGSEGALVALAAEGEIPMLFLLPGKAEVSPYIEGLVIRFAVEACFVNYSSYPDAIDKLEGWLVYSHVADRPFLVTR